MNQVILDGQQEKSKIGIKERNMGNPYAVTKQFEEELCNYTGSRFAVCVNSCTAALQLCLEWLQATEVSIPKHTYVSVPMSIRNARAIIRWRDEDWRGSYQLKPYPIWDSARRFTSGMYRSGQFQCVSFSASKILGMEQGDVGCKRTI